MRSGISRFQCSQLFLEHLQKVRGRSGGWGVEGVVGFKDISHADNTAPKDTCNKSDYPPMHPNFGKLVQVIRSPNHNTIPNFTGRFLPQNDNQDIHDLYCTSILTLVRPWHKLAHLKPGRRSQDEEFEQFIPTCPKRLQDIIGNLQHYYRCGNATMKES